MDLTGNLTEIYSNPLFLLILLWSLPWKGYALWKAAQNEDKVWYVLIFLVNLAAIESIVYIFYFSKRSKTEKTSKRS